MPQSFLARDRKQERLSPPGLREWLPEDTTDGRSRGNARNRPRQRGCRALRPHTVARRAEPA